MFGLPENTIKKLSSVFQKYPEIEKVIIYGSRAKGSYREGSDIDITLKGKAIPEATIYKLEQDIDELNTPYLFDISIFKNLNSDNLINHINRVGKVFYEKEFDKIENKSL